MKKLISLLVLFCSLSLGQGWNSTVTTTINEPNLEKMDLFTNSFANFLLIKRTNGYILCYRLTTSGQLITPVEDAPNPTVFSTNGDFPAITGTSNIVYAFYKEGNNIKGKYSTNGGNNWNNLPDRSTSANECNAVDAVYEEGLSGGVHIVWATRDSDPNFETYYSRLTPYPNFAWVEFKNVTDHSSYQYGGFPSVAYSSERVHVNFNTLYDDPGLSWPGLAGTRDRYNGVWQTPQSVIQGTERSYFEKLIVRGSTLFLFYSQHNNPSGHFIWNDLLYRTRSVSGTTWSSPSTLAYTIANSRNSFDVCKTVNDNIHLISDGGTYNGQGYGLTHSFYNGTNWSTPVSLGNEFYKDLSLNSVSNDLFTTWAYYGDNNPRYKQNDQNPLVPSNFAGGIHDVGWNAYPKITWSTVNEPDVRNNPTNAIIVERSKDFGAFTVIANLSGGATSYIDFSIPYAGSGNGSARYRIKSRDINSHESPWTSVVNIAYGNAWKIGGDESIVYVKPENFYLSSNYPNPFNPSTRINYAVPEEANVQLKVYDILGSEIVELVNETKRAGYHIVDFDATNLSSGIYIYRITAISGERLLFSESKRMILMK